MNLPDVSGHGVKWQRGGGREREKEDVIDQEDALRIFAISVGENYGTIEHRCCASKRGNATPINSFKSENDKETERERERVGGLSGVTRLSLRDLSLSLSLVAFSSAATLLRRVSLWHVTEIHQENYVTNALGYIS